VPFLDNNLVDFASRDEAWKSDGGRSFERERAGEREQRYYEQTKERQVNPAENDELARGGEALRAGLLAASSRARARSMSNADS